MDLDLAARDEVLARFVQYAPHAVMTGIAHALDLPEPAFYDDDDGQPIADEFDAYIAALSADVEVRRITFVQLLRAAAVAPHAPDYNGDDGYYERLAWIRKGGGFRSSLRDFNRTCYDQIVNEIIWYPRRLDTVGTGGPYGAVAYVDYRQSPATATLVPPRTVKGVIEWLTMPLALRYRRNDVAALYDALAASTLLDGGIIDWAPIARWMQLVPMRTGAPYTLVAPGQRWSAEQVRSLLHLAERQGVTAYQLFDACKAVGQRHLADLVVWHLTQHPAAYALVHGIGHHAAAAVSVQKSAAEISSARLGSAEAVGLESVAAVVDPMPDSCSLSEAESAMAQLPMEMVVAVLRQLWALDDLIVCRRVCRRWRAAVAILATHDRRFAYCCGLHDWRTIQNLPGIPELALPITHLAGFHESRPAMVEMWCTCGHLLPNIVSSVMFDCAAEVLPKLPPYADRHADQSRPPARWAQLRPSRDLALELAHACSRIDSRVLSGHLRNRQGPWLPLFLWLPEAVVRPSNTAELLALVRHLVGYVQDDSLALSALWTSLSDPVSARAWYLAFAVNMPASMPPATMWEAAWLQARPPPAMSPTERAQALNVRLGGDNSDPYGEVFARDFPAFDIHIHDLKLADDIGGWEKRRFLARNACLQWSHTLGRGMNPYRGLHGFSDIDHFEGLNAATAHDIAVHLFDQVHVVDRVVSLFDERCVHSCTYNPLWDGDYVHPRRSVFGDMDDLYVIGLDPRGHLVGAVTATIVPL